MYATKSVFPLVAVVTLSILPNNGSAGFTVNRAFRAYQAPKRAAAGMLTVNGVDTEYRLVSGGYRGSKMFYVYTFIGGKSVYMPLEAVEYAVFKESAVTVTFEAKVELPISEKSEKTEEPGGSPTPTQDAAASVAVAEDAPPAKLSKRAQRRGLKAVA